MMEMQTFDATVERALAAGGDDLGAHVRMLYHYFLEEEIPHPESPIEHALIVGLITLSVGAHFFEFSEVPPESQVAAWRAVSNRRAIVKCQEVIGSYRVDFLINLLWKQEPIGSIVVECDGHDFHERTKEQAARDRSRDRALTTAGYTVLRFTGSEIYRQPMACAWDVFAAADALVTKAQG